MLSDNMLYSYRFLLSIFDLQIYELVSTIR